MKDDRLRVEYAKSEAPEEQPSGGEKEDVGRTGWSSEDWLAIEVDT